MTGAALDADVAAFCARVPRIIVAIDVETTGFSQVDRVVSFGAVRLDMAGISGRDLDAESIEFFCNPSRACHPRAAAVHGLSAEFLARQPPFEGCAGAIFDMIASADLLVAHNAPFDTRFLRQEFDFCGLSAALPACVCTRHLSGLHLDDACEAIGLPRRSGRHGALEDAWLSLMIYLAAMGAPGDFIAPFPRSSPLGQQVPHGHDLVR